MKRCGWIGVLFVAMVMTACHRPVETVHTPSAQRMELAAIDSLMWTYPDSALTRLIPCFDNASYAAMEESDRHYAHLLLAELLYKNDYTQTNRAELLEAVGYFDTVGCPFLAARAHYINGVGYYEQDSVVPACEEYLKAVETMEEHFGEKDLVGKKAKFMALAYTHLTALFSNQYLHEQAIYFGKRSLPYYYKHQAEPWHIAWMLGKIGSHYNMIEQWDSAIYYYDKAIEVLPDTNNLTYRDIATVKAFLSYNKEKKLNPH